MLVKKKHFWWRSTTWNAMINYKKLDLGGNDSFQIKKISGKKHSVTPAREFRQPQNNGMAQSLGKCVNNIGLCIRNGLLLGLFRFFFGNQLIYRFGAAGTVWRLGGGVQTCLGPQLFGMGRRTHGNSSLLPCWLSERAKPNCTPHFSWSMGNMWDKKSKIVKRLWYKFWRMGCSLRKYFHRDLEPIFFSRPRACWKKCDTTQEFTRQKKAKIAPFKHRRRVDIRHHQRT